MNTRIFATIAGLFLSAATLDTAAAPSSRSGIVVFTGSDTRVETGLRMYMRGDAERLLISGFDEKRDAPQLLRDFGIPQTRPLNGIEFDRSLDTLENGRNTNLWIKKHGLGRVTIVTSDFHLNRSMLMLRRQNPSPATIYSACRVSQNLSVAARNAEDLKYLAAFIVPAMFISDARETRAGGSGIIVKISKWLPKLPVNQYPAPPC